MSATGRVAVGALIGAATAALFLEGVQSGGEAPLALPAVPVSSQDADLPPASTKATLVSATSARSRTATTTSSTTTTTSSTTTTTSGTTTATTATTATTTTTTRRLTTTTLEPPPPTTTTTTTTTTTRSRPCGLLWCP